MTDNIISLDRIRQSIGLPPAPTLPAPLFKQDDRVMLRGDPRTYTVAELQAPLVLGASWRYCLVHRGALTKMTWASEREMVPVAPR